MHLIPSRGQAPIYNYYCTFAAQGSWGLKRKVATALEARDRLDSAFLFGPNGVLPAHPAKIRGDMLALLDDGWDVPAHLAHTEKNCGLFGSMNLDEGKFPEYAALPPAERLRAIADRVAALGYAGLGLWIPANAYGEPPEGSREEDARAFWREKGKLCAYADVKYLKVDWGYHGRDLAYRAMMTEEIKRHSPGTLIEHAVGIFGKPYDPSPEAQRSPEFAEFVRLGARAARAGDVYRTYDVVDQLSAVTTLMRIAKLADAGLPDDDRHAGIINVEDNPIIAAALGMSMGIMRHIRHPRYGEVAKALIWQRLAPPFRFEGQLLIHSDALLCDSYHFNEDPGVWPHVGRETIAQYAPGTLSNRAPLAEVVSRDAAGDAPFVLCSRHPLNDALTVAALPRTMAGKAERTPLASVRARGAAAGAPIGVFGRFADLSVEFDDRVSSRRVCAQNMLSDEAADITDEVKTEGNILKIPGNVLERFGQNKDENDASDGAVVLLLA